MIRRAMDESVWDTTGAMQEAVGAAIRTRRETLGWKQEDLAVRAKLDKGTISRIERGANPTIDTLLMVTRALGVELEIVLRDPSGQAQTVRDVLPPMTSDVMPPRQTVVAPGKEVRSVPFPSFPDSPVHMVLYGLVAAITEEHARKLWRPLLDLVEAIERGDDPPKLISNRKPKS